MKIFYLLAALCFYLGGIIRLFLGEPWQLNILIGLGFMVLLYLEHFAEQLKKGPR